MAALVLSTRNLSCLFILGTPALTKLMEAILELKRSSSR